MLGYRNARYLLPTCTGSRILHSIYNSPPTQTQVSVLKCTNFKGFLKQQSTDSVCIERLHSEYSKFHTVAITRGSYPLNFSDYTQSINQYTAYLTCTLALLQLNIYFEQIDLNQKCTPIPFQHYFLGTQLQIY